MLNILRILLVYVVFASAGVMDGPRMMVSPFVQSKQAGAPHASDDLEATQAREQWEKARMFLEESIQARPSDPEVLSRYGKMLRLRGNTWVCD
jgi:hypothetical protein